MKSPLVCLFIAISIVGCGAAQKTATQKTIDMEPVVIEVKDKDGRREVNTYDAESLFNEAKKAYQSEQFSACIEKYTQLLDQFTQSRFVVSARFNRGLCYEESLQHGLAVQDFRLYIDTVETDKDKLDGFFRWGFNLVEAGNYPIAKGLYDELLTRTDLGEFDRAEAHLRRGISLAGMRQYAVGERDLRQALKLVKKAAKGEVLGNDIAAECHYRKGDIYGELSRDVKLKLPLENMESDLQAKIRFFRQSQSSYIDTLNVRSPYWSTAAGLKLGELYQRFYEDVVAAEVPPSFDQTMRRFYLLELKKRLQPVLVHSVKIYERNMAMGLRLGTENEWTKETEKRLEKLRALIEQNNLAAKELDEKPATPNTKKRPPKRRKRTVAKPAGADT